MDDPVSAKPGIAEWLRKLIRRSGNDPIQLKIQPTPTKLAPVNAVSPKPIPGNYYFFEFFIEISLDGVIYLGYPKTAIHDVGVTPPVLRWASPLKLAAPDPSISRIRWIDDPKTGLAQRTITCAQDLLGAEGIVGKKKLRFEQILQETKNQVVYSLYNEDGQFRIAYAFPRELFGGGQPVVPNQPSVSPQ
jgi:hypothetical protein